MDGGYAHRGLLTAGLGGAQIVNDVTTRNYDLQTI
jgi:hypothetical protein